MSTFKVNTTLGIIDYVTIVESMVNEYFNDDGDYVPQIGILNIMRLFYNECVLECKFDVPHTISDALDMEVFINDEEFIEAFNLAIQFNGVIAIDFANAYKDAMDIVSVKKSSVDNAVRKIKVMFADIVSKISDTLTPENIDKITKISENIANGKITNEAIVDAFGKSEMFSKILGK